MENSKLKNKALTLPIQGSLLKLKYPEASVIIKMNCLIWYGKIKPTPLSREFNIKIVCEKGNKPKVFMYGNHIEKIEREDFPHIYSKNLRKQEVRLCLNYPHEFDYSHRIIDTIIPWTQEWLVHYEIWLATNKWCGGGHVVS